MSTAEAPATQPLAADEAQPARSWYLHAIAGAVGLAVGLLILAYPDVSADLLGIFIGIDLLVAGGVCIVRDEEDPTDRSVTLMLGTLALIAGLLAIRFPGHSVTVIVLAFAIYLVVAGALALGRGLVHAERRWTRLARGAVFVVLGTLIISWPDISVATLALFAGVTLVLDGALELAEAFALRARARR